MIYVSEKFVVVTLFADFLMLVIALVFRKSRKKKEKLQEDTRLSERLGYYLITASLLTLILAHFAYFPSLFDYIIGFLMDMILFLMGIKMVEAKKHE